MRNTYAGPCYRCGLVVEAGTGHFERRQRSWRVQHAYHSRNGGVTCVMAKERAGKTGEDRWQATATLKT